MWKMASQQTTASNVRALSNDSIVDAIQVAAGRSRYRVRARSRAGPRTGRRAGDPVAPSEDLLRERPPRTAAEVEDLRRRPAGRRGAHRGSRARAARTPSAPRPTVPRSRRSSRGSRRDRRRESRSAETAVAREDDRLRARPHAELVEQIRDVVAHGLLADARGARRSRRCARPSVISASTSRSRGESAAKAGSSPRRARRRRR